mmetsp:Transcript_20287/g.25020  ORF Transcript_20287/g.25020 Transcript_20287/m.25020 type:complete len:157 (+) Transcript_20287:218-688(+)
MNEDVILKQDDYLRACTMRTITSRAKSVVVPKKANKKQSIIEEKDNRTFEEKLDNESDIKVKKKLILKEITRIEKELDKKHSMDVPENKKDRLHYLMDIAELKDSLYMCQTKLKAIQKQEAKIANDNTVIVSKITTMDEFETNLDYALQFRAMNTH